MKCCCCSQQLICPAHSPLRKRGSPPLHQLNHWTNFLLPLERWFASRLWMNVHGNCPISASVDPQSMKTLIWGSSCFSKITPHCKKGQNEAVCGAKCGNGQSHHWPIQWDWCSTSLVTVEKLDEVWPRVSWTLVFPEKPTWKNVAGYSVTGLLPVIILHHCITQTRNLSISLHWTIVFLSHRSILGMMLKIKESTGTAGLLHKKVVSKDPATNLDHGGKLNLTAPLSSSTRCQSRG